LITIEVRVFSFDFYCD
jgi:hypothetical protein